MKLNLGCGKDIKEGYVNCDFFSNDKNVKKVDLDKLPLPFKDSSIKEIIMKDTFEHLHVDRLEFMKEIHRILKPNGMIKIEVPTFTFSADHTIPMITNSYFDAMCKRTEFVNEDYYHKYFTMNLKKTRRPFISMVWKIREILEFVFISKFEWELKK